MVTNYPSLIHAGLLKDVHQCFSVGVSRSDDYCQHLISLTPIVHRRPWDNSTDLTSLQLSGVVARPSLRRRP
jgi:hypothetical protein